MFSKMYLLSKYIKILPKPSESKVKFDPNKRIYLEEYDVNNLNSNPEGGKRDDDEEES